MAVERAISENNIALNKLVAMAQKIESSKTAN